MQDDNMNECLYQIIEMGHMRTYTGEHINADEWNEFCLKFIDAFAEEVSLLALEYWNQRGAY
jgi:hypothetical protein